MIQLYNTPHSLLKCLYVLQQKYLHIYVHYCSILNRGLRLMKRHNMYKMESYSAVKKMRFFLGGGSWNLTQHNKGRKTDPERKMVLILSHM